ncbi:MAG: peptide deformylase [Phycisphaeraceae bacterium]
MSIAIDKLKIVHYPHPVLRTKAQPLGGVSEEVRAVARKMIELMHEARGVGLAAPQVGLPWRLFVANPTGEDSGGASGGASGGVSGGASGGDRIYINPVLSDPSEATARAEEGCLSIPGVNVHVMRPVGVTIAAMNEHGEKITDTSADLLARIWQHETDHLNGVLIIDRMTPTDGRSVKRTLAQLEADFAKAAKK